jgi:hypothetical protein
MHRPKRDAAFTTIIKRHRQKSAGEVLLKQPQNDWRGGQTRKRLQYANFGLFALMDTWQRGQYLECGGTFFGRWGRGGAFIVLLGGGNILLIDSFWILSPSIKYFSEMGVSPLRLNGRSNGSKQNQQEYKVSALSL